MCNDEQDFKEITENLVATDLFADLNQEQLSRLAAIGQVKVFDRGHTVFNQGDEDARFFVVFSGAVRVSRTVVGMGEEAFAILRRGSVFGEMAVFDECPRSADAIVHERCELFEVEKDSLRQLFKHNRLLACDVLGKLVQLLSRRLRESNDKLSMLSVCAKFE